MKNSTFAKYCIPATVIFGGLALGWHWMVTIGAAFTWFGVGMLILARIMVKKFPEAVKGKTMEGALLAESTSNDVFTIGQRLIGLLVAAALVCTFYLHGFYLTAVAQIALTSYSLWFQKLLREKVNG